MSFIRQYRRLFKVAVQEEGSELELSGFSFMPTSQTRKLLENHQLVFRKEEAGFELYYSINPLAPEPVLGRISKRVQFSFSFLQSDANFFKRYEPDLTISYASQLYLDNLISNGDIQPDTKQTLTVGDVVQMNDAMKVYPPVFSVQTHLGEGETPPTTYRIVDKFDSTSTLQEIPVNAGSASQVATKIDLSGRPLGPYTLESDAADSTSRTIYLTNENFRGSVLGFIDIYWEEPQDIVPTDGVTYLIRFVRR